MAEIKFELNIKGFSQKWYKDGKQIWLYQNGF